MVDSLKEHTHITICESINCDRELDTIGKSRYLKLCKRCRDKIGWYW